MKQKFYVLLSLFVLASLVLAACGATSTTDTEAPSDESATSEFVGKSLVAADCDSTGIIKSVVATGEHEVVFTLCQPDPAFLSKIAFSVYGIYPEEWLEATAGEEGRTSEGLERPIGTGPYMLSEWNRGESITFTANPNYWGEAPKVDTLVFRWSTESAARLLELQSGTVDAIDNVGPTEFDVVRNDPNLVLMERPALNVFYVAMTNTFEPFNDIAVRQAIAKGIDRQRIVDNFYPAGSSVATHFTPCAIPNACEGDPWYEFDPEAAREELAAAGYPDGFSTRLYYRDVARGYLPQVSNVAQDIQAQLKENLNIDAEIVVMESGAFIEESSAGRLDGFYLLGWGADFPHITNFLDYHFSANNPQFGEQSPTYTDVIAQAAQIADAAESRPLYEEANNAIREFVPMIPVANGGSGTAWRADVTNPQASPLSNEVFYVSAPGDRDVFVWMQNGEPISLFCADETDGESLRACEQVVEALYSYEVNGTEVQPALAESCVPNDTLDEWTCTLRQGVSFHDGTTFDANDVVATFTMGLDSTSPLHKGNTNVFEYYDYLWGGLITKTAE